MIYSVFRYTSKLYDYYEAPGVTPPHGWFRRASPGALKCPEEVAAVLPAEARKVGQGPLPFGVIATDAPGLGSRDTDGIPDGRGAGLGQVLPMPPAINGRWHRYLPEKPVPRGNRPFEATPFWEPATSRGLKGR